MPAADRRRLFAGRKGASARAAARRRVAVPATVFVVTVFVTAVFVAAGCQRTPGEEPRQIEVVDVPPPLTVDVEQDPQARPRKPELVGLLPEGFPADLPLHLPASLIDFGDGDGGRAYVTLASPEARARVRAGLLAAARRQGWSVEEGGSALELRKGGRRVGLRLDDGRPGTVYRFDYPPG